MHDLKISIAFEYTYIYTHICVYTHIHNVDKVRKKEEMKNLLIMRKLNAFKTFQKKREKKVSEKERFRSISSKKNQPHLLFPM
jgi:hypothetical protein